MIQDLVKILQEGFSGSAKFFLKNFDAGRKFQNFLPVV